jgi:hypothetical protein
MLQNTNAEGYRYAQVDYVGTIERLRAVPTEEAAFCCCDGSRYCCVAFFQAVNF